MKSLLPVGGTDVEQYSCSCKPTMRSTKKLLLQPSMATTTTSPQPPSSSSSSSFIIAQMSQEQLITILQLLPVDSIIAFSATCREFSSLGRLETLWESICKREWGASQFNSLLETKTPIRSWRRLFQQVSQMGSLRCFELFTSTRSKDDDDDHRGILPEPRASHSLNWVQDHLLLFGGGCQGGRHLGDTWVANVGTIGAGREVSWHLVKSDGPTGRFGHTCTVVGNFLVLFGGINDNGIRQNDTWIGHVVVQDHNPTSDIKLSWKLLPLPDVDSVAPCPRGAHAGCVVGENNDKMVIHGGIGLNSVRLDDLWLLNISEDRFQWRRLIATTGGGRSPSPRSGHSLTWIRGNQMVLFGGRGIGYDVLNDVWVLNLTDLNCPFWVEVRYDHSPAAPSRIPPPRVGHSASLVLGGRVVIYGGEDSQRRRKDDFWVLDVSNMLATSAVGSNSNNNNKKKKKEEEEEEVWSRLEIEGTKTPECRSFHTACADLSGRYFYVFGGMVNAVNNDPAAVHGLSFDGGLYLVELVLDALQVDNV